MRVEILLQVALAGSFWYLVYKESETASIQSQPVALVSEKEYEYGADAFEIYMKENKGKIKPEMKEVAVQKNEKAR